MRSDGPIPRRLEQPLMRVAYCRFGTRSCEEDAMARRARSEDTEPTLTLADCPVNSEVRLPRQYADGSPYWTWVKVVGHLEGQLRVDLREDGEGIITRRLAPIVLHRDRNYNGPLVRQPAAPEDTSGTSAPPAKKHKATAAASTPVKLEHQAEYEALRKRFLEPIVVRDEPLPMGGVLRKATKPAFIDHNSAPLKALKARIRKHENSGDHAAIFYLLKQIKDWQMRPGGAAPPAMRLHMPAGSSSDVAETVDLSEPEPPRVTVDLEQWITEVLLVAVVKSDPDAAAAWRERTSAVKQEIMNVQTPQQLREPTASESEVLDAIAKVRKAGEATTLTVHGWEIALKLRPPVEGAPPGAKAGRDMRFKSPEGKSCASELAVKRAMGLLSESSKKAKRDDGGTPNAEQKAAKEAEREAKAAEKQESDVQRQVNSWLGTQLNKVEKLVTRESEREAKAAGKQAVKTAKKPKPQSDVADQQQHQQQQQQQLHEQEDERAPGGDTVPWEVEGHDWLGMRAFLPWEYMKKRGMVHTCVTVSGWRKHPFASIYRFEDWVQIRLTSEDGKKHYYVDADEMRPVIEVLQTVPDDFDAETAIAKFLGERMRRRELHGEKTSDLNEKMSIAERVAVSLTIPTGGLEERLFAFNLANRKRRFGWLASIGAENFRLMRKELLQKYAYHLAVHACDWWENLARVLSWGDSSGLPNVGDCPFKALAGLEPWVLAGLPGRLARAAAGLQLHYHQMPNRIVPEQEAAKALLQKLPVETVTTTEMISLVVKKLWSNRSHGRKDSKADNMLLNACKILQRIQDSSSLEPHLPHLFEILGTSSGKQQKAIWSVLKNVPATSIAIDATAGCLRTLLRRSTLADCELGIRLALKMVSTPTGKQLGSGLGTTALKSVDSLWQSGAEKLRAQANRLAEQVGDPVDPAESSGGSTHPAATGKEADEHDLYEPGDLYDLLQEDVFVDAMMPQLVPRRAEEEDTAYGSRCKAWLKRFTEHCEVCNKHFPKKDGEVMSFEHETQTGDYCLTNGEIVSSVCRDCAYEHSERLDTWGARKGYRRNPRSKSPPHHYSIAEDSRENLDSEFDSEFEGEDDGEEERSAYLKACGIYESEEDDEW